MLRIRIPGRKQNQDIDDFPRVEESIEPHLLRLVDCCGGISEPLFRGRNHILRISCLLSICLAGPIANQVLISRWFRQRRGQAMDYAYLGLGLGGVVAPLLVN